MREAYIKNAVLAGLAGIGSFLARALGGWDTAVTLLVVMMAADLVAGVAVAAVWKRSPNTKTGGLSSRAAFQGFTRKIAVMVLVCIGHLMDAVLGADYIRTATVCFFIGSEGLSLVENLGLMGVPLPGFLKKALEVLRDKGDGGGDGGIE